MANISAADVKKLRDLTGAGMMDCKKALTEAALSLTSVPTAKLPKVQFSLLQQRTIPLV